MLLLQRRPRNLIHQSDQGCQYTSVAFGSPWHQARVRPSTDSVADSFDNAMCESFFATLKCELLNTRLFATPAETRLAVFDFIEDFYKPVRRHSALG